MNVEEVAGTASARGCNRGTYVTCSKEHNTSRDSSRSKCMLKFIYKIKKNINFILLNLGEFPWILDSIFCLFTKIFK